MENFKKLCFLFFSFFGLPCFAQYSDSLKSLGTYHLRNHNLDTATVYFLSAIDGFEKELNLVEVGKCHINLGLVYKRQGLFAESIAESETAIELFEALKDDTLVGHSEYALGLVLKEWGVNNRAIKHLSKSVEIFEQLNYSKNVARAYQPIANLYKDMGEIDQSKYYLFKSREIYLNENDSSGLGTTLHNLAQVYILEDSLTLALSCLNKEREIKLRLGKPIHSTNTLLGEVFLKQKAYDSAYFYFRTALNERKRENNKIDLASSYFHLGNYYYQINLLDSAMFSLDSGYRIAHDFNQSQILIDIIELQITIDKVESNDLPIFKRYTELLSLRDSVLGEKSQIELRRFEVEYSLIEKDKRIELNEATIKIKNVENENLNFKYKAALLVILAIFILIVIIFFLSLRMRKKSQLLIAKNEMIGNLHQELTHRTKNYYQMFGGMLRYDLDDASSQDAKDLLNRYISRVEAMSQIQHHLIDTQNGLKENIELNIYLNELIDQIDLALNHKSPKVEIIKNLEPVVVKYHEALRLGIALNELLQNAFKHSFNKIEAPKIIVQLLDDKEGVMLLIKDNGIGFLDKNVGQKTSNGIRLISLLLKNTKTKMDYNFGAESGVEIKLKLPK